MTTLLYKPLFNILVLLYKYIPGGDIGIAIIILTILVKLLLYPLGTMAIRSQKALTDIQPKMKEIQEKYKNDKAKKTEAILELYKKEKINPFYSFLPIIIQLPILIALYKVFWFRPEQFQWLYSFVKLGEPINTFFLGLIDLSKPNILLAVLAGIMQFLQTKMMNPKQKKKETGFAGAMQSQMTFIFPVFTILIMIKLPSALGLYWIATSLFTIIQQYLVSKNEQRKNKTSS